MDLIRSIFSEVCCDYNEKCQSIVGEAITVCQERRVAGIV